MLAGLKSCGRIKPLDGLAFLISAITAGKLAACLARMAPTKSRVAACSRAWALMSSKAVWARKAATSSALVAKICFKMSFMFAH